MRSVDPPSDSYSRGENVTNLVSVAGERDRFCPQVLATYFEDRFFLQILLTYFVHKFWTVIHTYLQPSIAIKTRNHIENVRMKVPRIHWMEFRMLPHRTESTIAVRLFNMGGSTLNGKGCEVAYIGIRQHHETFDRWVQSRIYSTIPLLFSHAKKYAYTLLVGGDQLRYVLVVYETQWIY